MIRNVTVCLMSVGSYVVPVHAVSFNTNALPVASAAQSGSHSPLESRLFLMPIDRIRATETQERAVLERAKQQERDVRARRDVHQRQFEVKFNQLVDAVASFAKRYNEGKGTTWPQREADKLRKAMRQLQSIEKSLRDDPSAQPAPLVVLQCR